MAMLQATKMLEWRRNSSTIYKDEFKYGMYGALNFFLAQNHVAGSIVSDELRNSARVSMGNTLKIPVLKRNTTATVATTRSCTVPANEVDSALVTPEWQTVADGFVIYRDRYNSNDVKYNADFNAKMRDMLRRIALKLDQLCVANLELFKTAAINDPLNYTFSSSLLAAKWNDRMDIMGDLIAMMASNNYFGRINLVGNAGVMNLLNKLMEHGTYNDVNKAYEYLDKMLWLTSNVSNASNKYCTGYAIPDGHVGIIEKLPRTCLAGEEANGHVWGKTTLPLMGDLQFGTHFYSTVGDYSTETGESDMICDIADYYGFELNFALLNSYRSVVADPTPVIKWNIATGDNGVYYTEAVQ